MEEFLKKIKNDVAVVFDMDLTLLNIHTKGVLISQDKKDFENKLNNVSETGVSLMNSFLKREQPVYISTKADDEGYKYLLKKRGEHLVIRNYDSKKPIFTSYGKNTSSNFLSKVNDGDKVEVLTLNPDLYKANKRATTLKTILFPFKLTMESFENLKPKVLRTESSEEVPEEILDMTTILLNKTNMALFGVEWVSVDHIVKFGKTLGEEQRKMLVELYSYPPLPDKLWSINIICINENISYEKILLIDDKSSNCKSAKARGCQIVHVKGSGLKVSDLK